MDRLFSYGLHVNLKKCEFFKEKVSYVGHKIDSEESPEKIKAVKEAKRLDNVSELRSF